MLYILIVVTFTSMILDWKIKRKYIRHDLNLAMYFFEVYVLLTPSIIYVSLNLSGVNINLFRT